MSLAAPLRRLCLHYADICISITFPNTLYTFGRYQKRILSPARNYVIWSASLRSPGYTGWNLAERPEIKSYYVIMTETIVQNSIYDPLTRMETVDKIINVNASKAALILKLTPENTGPIFLSWVWWKWEILCLECESNPHLWHSGQVCYHYTM